ncbi:MAG: carbohydrate kinase family protein [Proteobacteria bacterium]|nr:carbohydrate kinase family protein [Pseudomonadota bacterium]
MSILVTGSVAMDHIMVFEDRFKNHILPDKVHMLNVSFLVPSLERLWGGTGANIAYNLRILGQDPVLLATVGQDFDDYARHLDAQGIRRDWLKVLPDAYTAQAYVTTDLDDNQIWAFHPGAMERAHEARLEDVNEDLKVGIVAANGKRAMQENARGLKQRGIACVVDPGQGLPLFSGDELIELLDGAAVYVVNDYEWAVTLERTGLSEDDVAAKVQAVIVTKGGEGSVVREQGRETEIPAVRAERVVDPTGCGDAYRAGILYALHEGMPLATGARIGSLLGALKIAERGPQSIELEIDEFRQRFEREYGSFV